MTLCDLHTHSLYSFDGAKDATPDALCRRALELGLSDVAITDHCDVDGEVEGIYDLYDADAAWNAMTEAKEKYAGRLNLIRGIELGNAHHCPDYARAALARHPYEYVIGSLHNLSGVPDFCMLRYEIMTPAHIAQIFDRALDETLEMLSFDGITTLGHMTYMHRYLTRAKLTLDFKPYYEKIRAIYAVLIDKGIALEVNVSSLWKDLGVAMPTLELIRLYADCGGHLITVGSDAHAPQNLGKAIRKGYALLNAAGLHEVTVIRGGEKVQVGIE